MPILTKDNMGDLDLYVRNHIYEYLAMNDETVTDDDRRKYGRLDYKEFVTIQTSFNNRRNSENPASSMFSSLKYLRSKNIFVEIKLGNEVVNLAQADFIKTLYRSIFNSEVYVSLQRSDTIPSALKTITGLSKSSISDFVNKPFSEKRVETTLLVYSGLVRKIKFPPVDRINVEVCPGLIPS